jgi:hypothetical protein
VGGTLGVLLKASRVRSLSFVAIFFAAGKTITDEEGRTGWQPTPLHSS